MGLGPRAWTALALVYVVWGATYLGMAVGAETVPPFLLLAGRFGVAGALLYAIASRGRARPSAREWVAQSLVGTALLGVGVGAVAWAVTRIDSGTAALIVASVPLWLALFDRVFTGARLSPVAIVGLVVGFVGVGILVGPGLQGSAAAGLTLVFTSAVWAVGTLGARSAPRPDDPFLAAAMQMVAGSVACLLLGTAFGEWGDLTTPSTRSLLALGFLIVFGSLVAFSAYVWLLSKISTSVVGTYAYVNPVVAVLLGALFLDERLSGTTALAGLAIVAAVALIVSARPVEARTPSAALPARAR